MFRVNVSNYKTGGNLYLPPKGQRGLNSIFWFLMSISPANPFGKLYSGKTTLDFSINVDILVKVNRFHLIEIVPPKPMEIGPDQLTSIPVEVKNTGSHADSFNFRINTTAGNDLKISPPPALTLQPGETRQALLGVASPLTFQGPGTTHSINIEAYSIHQPDKVFTNTVIITTKGFYVSEINWIYLAIFGIFIALRAAFFLFKRKQISNATRTIITKFVKFFKRSEEKKKQKIGKIKSLRPRKIDRKAEMERCKKEKVILQIQKTQEKQEEN
ncbi:hypothetical protein MBGDN05_00347 [Thermoplasmatales archaeon SCGC AB-539-N05]|nr:hypothetical protein MBGDN05_00347 [Thermoplasmatales archaeon SCGC AB-539-N05]